MSMLKPSRMSADRWRAQTHHNIRVLINNRKHGGKNQSADMLANVANTMTDCCVTNAAVDHQLEVAKGAPLKFKCGMHPLDSN